MANATPTYIPSRVVQSDYPVSSPFRPMQPMCPLCSGTDNITFSHSLSTMTRKSTPLTRFSLPFDNHDNYDDYSDYDDHDYIQFGA